MVCGLSEAVTHFRRKWDQRLVRIDNLLQRLCDELAKQEEIVYEAGSSIIKESENQLVEVSYEADESLIDEYYQQLESEMFGAQDDFIKENELTMEEIIRVVVVDTGKIHINAFTGIYSYGHVLISICPLENPCLEGVLPLRKYVCINMNPQFMHIFSSISPFEWSIRQKTCLWAETPFGQSFLLKTHVYEYKVCDYIDMFFLEGNFDIDRASFQETHMYRHKFEFYRYVLRRNLHLGRVSSRKHTYKNTNL
ncbi:hypothetical protein Taro_010393 [Colocasia esculenta]|uniref:Uncharacterized protein n=1 Tax=Colocasia esculenta TaxID=4460 RepID=A0A843U7G6_COLES|nr:hypothetical protein [Colocasia esculenta]